LTKSPEDAASLLCEENFLLAVSWKGSLDTSLFLTVHNPRRPATPRDAAFDYAYGMRWLLAAVALEQA